MTGLAAHGIPVFAARAGIELTVLVTGWVLGGSVGIATVVFAASIGPLVQRALPWLAVASPPWLAVASPPAPSTHGRGRAPQRGFDRIGGRTEFVRGDMCDGPGLACGIRGMPCCSTQVSGRAHCLAARCASLGHRDLATYPGASMLDRLTRSWVLRLGRLEEVKDVLRARCRPKSKELVVRIGEGPTAADRHEARVSNLREDHGWHSYHSHPPNTQGRRTRDQPSPEQSLQTRWSIALRSRPLLCSTGLRQDLTKSQDCTTHAASSCAPARR